MSAQELTLAQVREGLEQASYLPDEGLVAAIFLAMSLQRPLLLEGEAGVGKTEVAKALAAWTGGQLIRLQCYEGIGVAQAVYEWDYARQLMSLRVREASRSSEAPGEAERPAGLQAAAQAEALEHDLYSERFLVKRPLLQAILPPGADEAGAAGADTTAANTVAVAANAVAAPPPILLLDEVDRADDEFEAFLLEVLSDWSVTVPEIGTFIAQQAPLCVITSNRTRDIHDALRRRCLYHWVEHPDLEREVAIVTLRARGVSQALAQQVAQAVARLREANFYKPPSVAESISWATALAAMDAGELTPENADLTLGAVLKYKEDQDRARSLGLAELVAAG